MLTHNRLGATFRATISRFRDDTCLLVSPRYQLVLQRVVDLKFAGRRFDRRSLVGRIDAAAILAGVALMRLICQRCSAGLEGFLRATIRLI